MKNDASTTIYRHTKSYQFIYKNCFRKKREEVKLNAVEKDLEEKSYTRSSINRFSINKY